MIKRDRQKEIDNIIKVRDKILDSHKINKTKYAKRLGYKNLQAYESVEKKGANVFYLFHLYHSFGVPPMAILFDNDPPSDLKD